MHRWSSFAVCVVLVACSASLLSQSFYPLRPNDEHAVYLERGAFGVKGDGVADDSDALQKAIDHVQETTYDGVVLIPEGRYRLGKTVVVWEGIRLIGYGAHRPVFVLGKNTPGFQQGTGHYMVQFADRRPAAGQPVPDASEFTFYSGMSNIDFEIEDGNPAAVGVRFHVAQHSALVHMNFHVSSALAALDDIGNQASDIHIDGGKYGIVSKKTSPAWQFLLMDSSFEHQSVAAIHTQEVGFTLVRDRFAHVPVALEIAAGEVEQLYGRDLQMEDVTRAALSLGDWKNLRSEVTLENIACSQVPTFVEGGASVQTPGRFYLVDHYRTGLKIGSDGRELGIVTEHKEHALTHAATAVPSDIPALPPMTEWTDVKTLGAKGDGGADDTAALQAAIDGHRVLFLPSGLYRLTGSLKLKPDTVLIALNPVTTQLVLADGTAEFQGDGPAIPLLIAPKGGRNIVTGIGIATGLNNPRAAGVLWMAGKTSMLEDINFISGHSPYVAALAPARPAPAPMTRAQREAYYGTEYPDLWVKDGGGGIFRGSWTHDSNAKSGFRIENTATESKVYQHSCEHHMHVEVELRNVMNWSFYALQTEEENPAGAEAIAANIENSNHVVFANTYMYRVSRNVFPKLYAIRTANDNDIEFKNVKVFSQTRLAFDNTLFDQNSGITVRPHDFTCFAVQARMKARAPLPLPAAFERDAKLERLATGFSNASGLVADAAGTIYFTDAALHRIYRWNASGGKAEVLAEIPGSPIALGFVPPHTLLIMAYEKAVYSLNVSQPGAAPQPVAETASLVPGTTLLLPVGLHNELWNLEWLLEHRGYTFRIGSNTAIRGLDEKEHRGYFYAPGTSFAMMGGGTWRADVQSSQFAPFPANQEQLIVSEDDARTYKSRLENGKLVSAPFLERGGTSIVSDEAGNVYIASGQVYIYNKAGEQIGILEVPERPGSVVFGGADRRTLYIGARASLYAIRTISRGQ